MLGERILQTIYMTAFLCAVAAVSFQLNYEPAPDYETFAKSDCQYIELEMQAQEETTSEKVADCSIDGRTHALEVTYDDCVVMCQTYYKAETPSYFATKSLGDLLSF